MSFLHDCLKIQQLSFLNIKACLCCSGIVQIVTCFFIVLAEINLNTKNSIIC